MLPRTRREFLADVGRGMLVAGVGSATAIDLGLATARAADESSEPLAFGTLEPLVRLMQDAAPESLLPQLVARLKAGTELRDLVAAAALANARTFGGEDYIGFHTMMALSPALAMSRELPSAERPLPVLKVLYRNSRRIQEHGGHDSEVLHLVPSDGRGAGAPADGAALLEAVHRKDRDGAEQTFAQIAKNGAEQAFNELLIAVQDNSEVHRIVMPYRAWDLLDIVGKEHAHTLLRQSVRYCVQSESEQYSTSCKGGRDVLPRLFDQYKLLSKPLGRRQADDNWVSSLADTIFGSTPDQAAEAAAAALAEGFAPEVVGEAMCLAANQLVLRDTGRPAEQARLPEKPVGSIHGDSIGVHACDSANAWRNMARVSNPRNTLACLILGSYQVARDRLQRLGDFLNWQPYPTAEHREHVRGMTPAELLAEADAAIRDNDQSRTCAAIERYSQEVAATPTAGSGPSEHGARPVFDLLLKYAISEDGALHAEKYYRTVADEFAMTRPAFRWRQLLALTRVTASSYGRPAPGLTEAIGLLQS
ncbi:MAG: hypothetical protein EXS05_04910 [Planctomycetaceae bacterium]|nr:hypothetical protein [Planctomycetaceae bacterium]